LNKVKRCTDRGPLRRRFCRLRHHRRAGRVLGVRHVGRSVAADAPTGKDMGLSMALRAYEFRSNERQRYIVWQYFNTYDLLVRTRSAEERHRFCAKPADVPDIRRGSRAVLVHSEALIDPVTGMS
jgi:hypothetical protein